MTVSGRHVPDNVKLVFIWLILYAPPAILTVCNVAIALLTVPAAIAV